MPHTCTNTQRLSALPPRNQRQPGTVGSPSQPWLRTRSTRRTRSLHDVQTALAVKRNMRFLHGGVLVVKLMNGGRSMIAIVWIMDLLRILGAGQHCGGCCQVLLITMMS
jgi:hypothetical protein